MALICATMKKTVSLVSFPFLSHCQGFSCKISLFLSLEMSMQLFYFPFLFSSYCCSVDPCVGSDHYNQSLLFSCSLRDVLSMYRRYFQCWRVLFLFFLTHIVCLYLWGVRPYASSWVFLFFGSFVEVLPSTTLRMVPSILRGWQPRCLSIWWDFCSIVWLRVIFSFSRDILFIIFFFPLVWWCSLPIFQSICKFYFVMIYLFIIFKGCRGANSRKKSNFHGAVTDKCVCFFSR